MIMEHFAHMINDILKRYKCFINDRKQRNPLGNKLIQSLKKRTRDYIKNYTN